MFAEESDKTEVDSSSADARAPESVEHHSAGEALSLATLLSAPSRLAPMDICIHEAGHALAHWYVGVPFVEARICSAGGLDAGIDAVVTGFKPSPSRAHWLALAAAGDETALARGRMMTQMEMFCAYAGPFAEGRHVPPPVRLEPGEKPYRQPRLRPDVSLFGGGGGVGDWALIEANVRDWPDGVALGAAARRLIDAFVRGQTTWNAIVTVARHLRRQGVLTWSEVSALASACFGRPGPTQADWIPHWPPLAWSIRGGFLPPRRGDERASG